MSQKIKQLEIAVKEKEEEIEHLKGQQMKRDNENQRNVRSIQLQLDKALISFPLKEGFGGIEHVEKLLEENVALTIQTKEMSCSVEMLEEKLKNFKVYDLEIEEWPECFDTLDFSDYLNNCM